VVAVTDVEATFFAYIAAVLIFAIPILAVDLIRQVRRTTREYRSRTFTGRRIE
jgi:hypothetical protein